MDAYREWISIVLHPGVSILQGKRKLKVEIVAKIQANSIYTPVHSKFIDTRKRNPECDIEPPGNKDLYKTLWCLWGLWRLLFNHIQIWKKHLIIHKKSYSYGGQKFSPSKSPTPPPVVTLSRPLMISSAKRPPKATHMRFSRNSLEYKPSFDGDVNRPHPVRETLRWCGDGDRLVVVFRCFSVPQQKILLGLVVGDFFVWICFRKVCLRPQLGWIGLLGLFGVELDIRIWNLFNLLNLFIVFLNENFGLAGGLTFKNGAGSRMFQLELQASMKTEG